MRRSVIASALCFIFLSVPGCARETSQPFAAWLEEFQQEAHADGIDKQLLREAFSDVEPIPRIIELDRAQPESTMTMQQYLKRVVTPQRVKKAQTLYHEHQTLLQRIGAQYNVQPEVIVALWGIETNFGDNTGGFGIIPALTTLAYDGRRSTYFRRELLNALRIAQEEQIHPDAMQGSWAGAMGQCQFMPTSFLKFAVDGDGDGKRDIWGSHADVFASIANYLHSEGWDSKHTLSATQEKQNNFNVLLKWNRSRYFATAVSALANKIQRGDG